jgi:hypothetical protein
MTDITLKTTKKIVLLPNFWLIHLNGEPHKIPSTNELTLSIQEGLYEVRVNYWILQGQQISIYMEANRPKTFVLEFRPLYYLTLCLLWAGVFCNFYLVFHYSFLLLFYSVFPVILVLLFLHTCPSERLFLIYSPCEEDY